MSVPSLSQALPSRSTPRPALRPLAPTATPARQISSHSLLNGARELVIRHQGSEYRLRLTRNDKLILTK